VVDSQENLMRTGRGDELRDVLHLYIDAVEEGASDLRHRGYVMTQHDIRDTTNGANVKRKSPTIARASDPIMNCFQIDNSYVSFIEV